MNAASRRGELAERMGTIGVSYRKTAPRGNGAPSRFPLRGQGGNGVGSRFRGNDVAPGDKGDGARGAPSWRYRADWIPAYAGMTGRGVGSCLRGQER